LAGYAELVRRLPEAPELVVAGAAGWGKEDPRARAAELGLAGRVRFCGYVPAADLPALYGAALGFALPSRYEGFGLPVVEAMAAGTPVVAADRTALPDTAGGAALLVDPEDPAAVAEAVLAARGDERLRAAGLERAAPFTWAATAGAVDAVLRRTAGRRPSS